MEIVTISVDELRQLLREVTREVLAEEKGKGAQRPTTPPSARRYVYGIDGIASLFNVSHPTAQIYRKTFLEPAVMQHGRKIITDADRAIELYNEHKNKVL